MLLAPRTWGARPTAAVAVKTTAIRRRWLVFIGILSPQGGKRVALGALLQRRNAPR
jgi:hypothetical protein